MNECVIEEIKMKNLEENYDIVVVGAGHAGCEAALAGARLGLNTIMFTVSDIWFVSWMLLAVRWEKILIRLLSSQKC